MWCPRCKKQYDDEFDTCLVCGGPLEDYTPILADEERDVLDLGDGIPNDSVELKTETPPEEVMPELLVSVAGEEEARRLATLLESLKIPCLCRKVEDTPETELEEWETEECDDAEALDDFEWQESEALPDDVAIYDLLVPQMLIRKALRILHEDEALQAEKEDAIAASEEAKEQPEPAEAESIDDVESAKEKPKKKFFGLFGKK